MVSIRSKIIEQIFKKSIYNFLSPNRFVGAKFVPGGSALSGAMVNCFIHVIMYSYYALAAMGDFVKPFLWWKKYLTILQLLQFTSGVVLGLHAILTDCQFTRWMQYFFVIYAFSFLVLFLNFYKRSYIENGYQKLEIRRPIKLKPKLIKETKVKNLTRSMRIQSRQQSQTKQDKTIKKKYKKK